MHEGCPEKRFPGSGEAGEQWGSLGGKVVTWGLRASGAHTQGFGQEEVQVTPSYPRQTSPKTHF